MRPDEYEHIVADHFKTKGYKTTVSSYSNDYGVDVFATKEKERIAIQAKMFGGSARPINRQMVMELHGAKDFFDCTKAVIATNGRILDNALEVAKKLNIEVLNVRAVRDTHSKYKSKNANTFESIWEKHVMPLDGKTLYRDDGKTNKIISIDWSGVNRITSSGGTQRIKIEIFKKVINHLLRNGEITRSLINEEYKERASSGVVLILGSTDLFEITKRPKGLRLKSK